MPQGYIKKLSGETGKSVQEVKRLWMKAKSLASREKTPGDPDFYAYAVGILQNMLDVEPKK